MTQIDLTMYPLYRREWIGEITTRMPDDGSECFELCEYEEGFKEGFLISDNAPLHGQMAIAGVTTGDGCIERLFLCAPVAEILIDDKGRAFGVRKLLPETSETIQRNGVKVLAFSDFLSTDVMQMDKVREQQNA